MARLMKICPLEALQLCPFFEKNLKKGQRCCSAAAGSAAIKKVVFREAFDRSQLPEARTRYQETTHRSEWYTLRQPALQGRYPAANIKKESFLKQILIVCEGFFEQGG